MGRRIKGLLCVISGLIFLVAGRAFYLQVWSGPDTGASLAAKALNFRSQVIPGEEYYRGEILDRNLISLTDSGVRPALVAFPTLITSAPKIADKLEKVLGLEANVVITAFRKGQDIFGSRTPVVLKKNLTAAEVEKMNASTIPGITVFPLKNRYGSQAVARHLIGYVNSINEKNGRI
jgi:penicillin-binding protein 2